jgi:glycosyltransferase involved in cell wall biosynthesis
MPSPQTEYRVELDAGMLGNETNHSVPTGSVSVAMCTFNGARFLAQQLRTIQEQIVLPAELVVCDDGSTDDSVAILEKFASSARFPVHIHRNAERLKFAQNFGKCISLCRGDIIALTDQDDLWYSTRIADTREAFAANPSLTYTFSDAPLIDAAGQELGATIYSNVLVMSRDRRRLRQGTTMLPAILRWGLIYGCTMAFRASFVPLILPIPELWSHDSWISLVLSSLGPSARQRPVTHYRQHSVQLAGGGKWTIRKHLEQAREREAAEYQAELRLFELGLAAAESRPALHTSLVPALRKRLAFLRLRLEVHSGGPTAIPSLFQLLRKGDYWFFGAGLRSALKDAAMMISFSAKK